MATAGQIRGALLEEVVLHLLEEVGYKVIRKKADAVIQIGLRDGHSGLDVEGRGSWHQIDALAEWEHSPAFIHPIRLLVEGKCYDKRVGIDVVRNAVGVLKDISENHFTDKKGRKGAAAAGRYNYLSAVFSATDYTAGAVEYAIAHQVFLIDYRSVPLVLPIIEAIKQVNADSFTPRPPPARQEPGVTHATTMPIANHGGRFMVLPCLGDDMDVWAREASEQASAEPETQAKGDKTVGTLRTTFAELLKGKGFNPPAALAVSPDGSEVVEEIQSHLGQIKGSYFGMLNGRWPMHFVLAAPLPPEAFVRDEPPHGPDAERKKVMCDKLLCKVFVTDNGLFSFEPEEIQRGQPGWFKLEASMPETVKKLILGHWKNDRARLNEKQKNLSFLTLSGKIGGIQRQVRLELSNEWIRRLMNTPAV